MPSPCTVAQVHGRLRLLQTHLGVSPPTGEKKIHGSWASAAAAHYPQALNEQLALGFCFSNIDSTDMSATSTVELKEHNTPATSERALLRNAQLSWSVRHNRKTTGRESREAENQATPGGMLNLAKAFSHMPGLRPTGMSIVSRLASWSRADSSWTEAVDHFSEGKQFDGFDLGKVVTLPGDFFRLLGGDPDTPDELILPKDIVFSFGTAADDWDATNYLADWLTAARGAPMGTDTAAPTCGIFPCSDKRVASTDSQSLCPAMV